MYILISWEESQKKFEGIVDFIIPTTSESGKIRKLRIFLIDKSYLDIRWSPSGKYSLHWER